MFLDIDYHSAMLLFEKSNCVYWIYSAIYGHWPKYSFSGTWFM